MAKKWRGVIEEFRKVLPVSKHTPRITLGEGNTPLIYAGRLAREIGFLGALWLKFEGANPTGSFKDRGMVLAVAKAKEAGARMLMCASTGNTAASAAAYGAEAEIPVVVFIPAGNVASGKLAQIAAYGATMAHINAKFDACQRIMNDIARDHPEIVVVNSTNPDRLAGQKTAAFEICDELHWVPDYHFIPVGNAGNITAYWMGYKEWCKRENRRILWIVGFADIMHPHRWDFERRPPRMMGYQAEGAAPIVRGKVVENPETIASAIKVGNPANWQRALKAASESGGRISVVSDAEIAEAHSLIPKLHPHAGCEPASAASVAGLTKAIRNGDIENAENVVIVCTLTGHLLKDSEIVTKDMEKPLVLDADVGEVVKFLKL